MLSRRTRTLSVHASLAVVSAIVSSCTPHASSSQPQEAPSAAPTGRRSMWGVTLPHPSAVRPHPSASASASAPLLPAPAPSVSASPAGQGAPSAVTAEPSRSGRFSLSVHAAHAASSASSKGPATECEVSFKDASGKTTTLFVVPVCKAGQTPGVDAVGAARYLGPLSLPATRGDDEFHVFEIAADRAATGAEGVSDYWVVDIRERSGCGGACVAALSAPLGTAIHLTTGEVDLTPAFFLEATSTPAAPGVRYRVTYGGPPGLLTVSHDALAPLPGWLALGPSDRVASSITSGPNSGCYVVRAPGAVDAVRCAPMAAPAGTADAVPLAIGRDCPAGFVVTGATSCARSCAADTDCHDGHACTDHRCLRPR